MNVEDFERILSNPDESVVRSFLFRHRRLLLVAAKWATAQVEYDNHNQKKIPDSHIDCDEWRRKRDDHNYLGQELLKVANAAKHDFCYQLVKSKD